VKLNKHQTGLALGAMVALAHVVWATMVFLGVAQPYLDWMLMLHSLNNPFQVLPFDLVRSLILVGATFVIGYIIGWAFANIWGRTAKK
jgi:cell division protein FtsX